MQDASVCTSLLETNETIGHPSALMDAILMEHHFACVVAIVSNIANSMEIFFI